MKLFAVVLVALLLHAFIYVSYAGPVAIPMGGGHFVISLPWNKPYQAEPASQAMQAEQQPEGHPSEQDLLASELERQRRQQRINADLAELEAKEQAPPSDLVLDTAPNATAVGGSGITKCRSPEGKITYQEGPCDSGHHQLKELSADEVRGTSASFKAYVDAQRATAARAPTKEAKAVVADLSADKSPPARVCGALLADKQYIQSQQRVHSNQYWRDQHTDVVKRLHALNCPSA